MKRGGRKKRMDSKWRSYRKAGSCDSCLRRGAVVATANARCLAAICPISLIVSCLTCLLHNLLRSKPETRVYLYNFASIRF